MITRFSYYPTTSAQVTPANSAVIKASPGVLHSFRLNYGGSVSPAYVIFFDAVAAPVNGAFSSIGVPKLIVPVASTWQDTFLPPHGWEFSTGIVAVMSSTDDQLTALTDDLTQIFAQYV